MIRLLLPLTVTMPCILAGYESSESDASEEDIEESITTNRECLLRCKEDNTTDPSLSRNPTFLQQPYRQQVNFFLLVDTHTHTFLASFCLYVCAFSLLIRTVSTALRFLDL